MMQHASFTGTKFGSPEFISENHKNAGYFGQFLLYS
jgi:hypothetical protein